MRRRRWWTWLADGVVVVIGALVAVGMIIGLGWGQCGGWRLIAAAAAGLAVAGVVCELPVARAQRAIGSVPVDAFRSGDGPDAGRSG